MSETRFPNFYHKNKSRKLTVEDIQKIKHLWKSRKNTNLTALSKLYKVSPPTIKRWLDDEFREKFNRNLNIRRRYETWSDVKKWNEFSRIEKLLVKFNDLYANNDLNICHFCRIELGGCTCRSTPECLDFGSSEPGFSTNARRYLVGKLNKPFNGDFMGYSFINYESKLQTFSFRKKPRFMKYWSDWNKENHESEGLIEVKILNGSKYLLDHRTLKLICLHCGVRVVY